VKQILFKTSRGVPQGSILGRLSIPDLCKRFNAVSETNYPIMYPGDINILYPREKICKNGLNIEIEKLTLA